MILTRKKVDRFSDIYVLFSIITIACVCLAVAGHSYYIGRISSYTPCIILYVLGCVFSYWILAALMLLIFEHSDDLKNRPVKVVERYEISKNNYKSYEDVIGFKSAFIEGPSPECPDYIVYYMATHQGRGPFDRS